MTDDGILLNATSLAPTRSRPAKISRAQMWPLKTSDAYWFKREAIPATIPNAPLWISKADALPHKTSIAPEQLVWASGLRTWERLAGRGIWVNGCAEGLGEQELSRIETLVGADLTWAKLTHDGAPAENGIAARESVVPTYRLVAKDGSPGLDDKKYFFWTSGSSFARALALNPSIKSQVHFSGPGNTQSALEKNGVKPHIFLDHEQWLKEMSW
jgi:hydroxymethylbilane synthase